MIFHPPSPEHPYEIGAHGDLSVEGLSSLEAIDEALDRLDAQRRALDESGDDEDDDAEVMWVVSIVPAALTQSSREDSYDTPIMNIGVGSDRVPVHWNHETGGNNAQAVSERSEDAGDDTEITYRLEGDRGWTCPAQLVPVEAAREAVRQWLRTGERPRNIAWEDL